MIVGVRVRSGGVIGFWSTMQDSPQKWMMKRRVQSHVNLGSSLWEE